MGKLVKYFVLYTILMPVLFFLLTPCFWIALTSIKTPADIYAIPIKIFPNHITFDNYVYLFNKTNFTVYFKNSMIVSLTNGIVTVLCSGLAAYTFSRMKFRGKLYILSALLATQAFPPLLLVIPIFILLFSLQLIDSLLGLIAVHIAFSIPFCTWLLKNYFNSIPTELDEAAMIDGCSRAQAALKIVFPLAIPGVVACFLFAFVLSWQEYLFALTLLRNDPVRTISVGITYFLGFRQIQWGPIAAASIVSTLPVAIFFVYLQRFLVQGLTLGGVKE